MDLKYLNTFRVIVEEGGFSRAARRLSYTQSTITFQMGQLEEELSVRLFEKIGRKMVLTEAGERLLPYVDEVLGSVDRLRRFDETQPGLGGALRVGVAETLLCYRLPPVLRELSRRAPGARLFLRSMNCYDIRDELMAGSLDVGVFYDCVGGFGGSLTAVPVAECPLALAASPRVGERCPDFVTPDRQIPLPFIINEPNCVFRQIFERYLRERSISLDHTIELWSIPTIKNLALNDVGVTYLPRFAMSEELERGGLVEIPTGLDGASLTAVCAHHRNKSLSPLMRLFIELCSGGAV